MNMKVKDMILVSLFAALTAIGAFIKFPVGPAPMSLQFLFTAFSAILLGSKLGALSQLIYLIIGLSGIPIFTGGGGIGYILNPTFGYLIGFVIGAFVIGKSIENAKSNSFMRLFTSCLIGLGVVYLIGVPYLYLILKNVVQKDITFIETLKSGLIVFLPGDFIKCFITSFIGFKIIPILNKLKANK
ncbi:MAG: biotin transporter BioY [Epulopiscium sp.]|nr:biotin transporter BioY [Candidatus Epulonipiscium sp.]